MMCPEHIMFHRFIAASDYVFFLNELLVIDLFLKKYSKLYFLQIHGGTIPIRAADTNGLDLDRHFDDTHGLAQNGRHIRQCVFAEGK